MKVIKIEKDKLSHFLKKLMEENSVYIPKEDGLEFVLSSDPSEFELNYDNTKKSIKELFFPFREPILQYELKGKSVEVRETFPDEEAASSDADEEAASSDADEEAASSDADEEAASSDAESEKNIVLFGTRPCDAFGIEAISRVFLQTPEDEFFKDKLERTYVLSFACETPDEACFCTSIHEGPAEIRGSDLLFVNVGENFLVKIVTEKGSKLIENARELFDDASDEDIKGLDEVIEKNKGNVKKDLKDAASLPEQLDFNDTFWKDAAPACIGCGVCTFLCPTCYCFDIQDEGNRLFGERVKIWDTCMFYDFTKMAAVQTRLEHYRRYRQRLMHKFKYYPDTFGIMLCTGCGRCIRYCPAGIDMLDVLDRMRKSRS